MNGGLSAGIPDSSDPARGAVIGRVMDDRGQTGTGNAGRLVNELPAGFWVDL